MEKIIRNPGSRNRKVHCYDKSRVCNKRYLCRDVIWNRHLWEKVNSERATRFLAISSVSSIIKCGWLFPNQWFGLHLKWPFSNDISMYSKSMICVSCGVDDEGKVPFCLPEDELNLHQSGASCSVPPWRTDSPSTPRCVSDNPGAAPPESSSWWTSGGFPALVLIFPVVNPQSGKWNFYMIYRCEGWSRARAPQSSNDMVDHY